MKAVAILPWIPVFPLIGFLVNGLLYLVSHSKLGGKDAPKGPHGHGDGGHADAHAAHGDAGHGGGHGEHHEIPFAAVHAVVGPAATILSCVAAFAAIFLWWGETHGHEGVVATLWTWMPLGANPTWFGGKALVVDAAFRLDALSALMLGFVTFIGSLIHVYSVGYMGHDEGFGRYFSYLNLFMFSMLTLVLGAGLPILFVGWEGVGLCSYLLIGFYWKKDWAADAGKKAFVVNRIGDFGFVLGIFGCFALFGTTDFGAMFSMAAANPAKYAAGGLMTAVCLALFIGACGKSAQIPLYVWLPDAMAGPTPVSALIHAATMVTAGVYMVARCNVFYRISHEWAMKTLGEHSSVWGLLTHDASFVVAVVGGATALFAATMGLAQTDIKKVLAYSTVSQLGYMFLGCGALAFSAGMFHVFTHAWFKACLFLGAGSVIHALGGEQDMTKMGGLRKLIPHTFVTMFVATLAIAGVPGLAGFFSKDAILAETWGAGYKVLWVLAVLTAGITAFYMFRLIKMTFYGTFRGTAEQLKHVHESPASMTGPLYVLAAGAAVVGWMGIPKFILGKENFFEGFLEPVITPLAAGLAAASPRDDACDGVGPDGHVRRHRLHRNLSRCLFLLRRLPVPHAGKDRVFPRRLLPARARQVPHRRALRGGLRERPHQEGRAPHVGDRRPRPRPHPERLERLHALRLEDLLVVRPDVRGRGGERRRDRRSRRRGAGCAACSPGARRTTR